MCTSYLESLISDSQMFQVSSLLLQVRLPYFPSDFPDCNAYLCLKATETAASNLKEELRPPALRPVRVPILSPWNSIRVSLEKGPTKVRNTETFRQEPWIRSSSSSNLECENYDVTFGPGNSFDGFVTRTSFSLTNFLNEFRGFVTRTCFVRVLLHAYKEGFFEEGAVVCAPQVTDISLWTR